MELDKRIMSGKKPLTCFDAEQARNFIGKKCYLTNDISLFSDLNEFKNVEWGNTTVYEGVVDTLTNINTEVTLIFETSYRRWRFCIPCEWVKEPEKKYRAYTLEEFIGDVNLGLEPWIRMRSVGTNKECKFLYTGYQETEVGEYICLGCFQFDFVSLFQNYEICINGEWQPFGVIDESQE